MILPILKHPDVRLKSIAKPVIDFNPIKEICSNMLETMYAANGIGLAAIQVDIPLRVIVIDISLDKKSPLVLINPEIQIIDDVSSSCREGCLSVPDIFYEIGRPSTIKVSAQTEYGEYITFNADGLLATCIQHEIDHLNGILFINHLSTMKQKMITKKLIKNN